MSGPRLLTLALILVGCRGQATKAEQDGAVAAAEATPAESSPAAEARSTVAARAAGETAGGKASARSDADSTPDAEEPGATDDSEVDESEDETEGEPAFVCPRRDGCGYAVAVEIRDGPLPAAGARVVIGLVSGVTDAQGKLRLELPPRSGIHKGVGVLVQVQGELRHNWIHLRDRLRSEGLKLQLGDEPDGADGETPP